MSEKLFLSPSIKFIPQMDWSVHATENGGLEATQTFLVRKADASRLGSGNLGLFVRASRWEQLYPEVPEIWKDLTIKTVGEGKSYAPGILSVTVTFTGYQFSSNGSSGDEKTVPTTSLRGTLEESPLIESRAWKSLDDAEKGRLGLLLDGTCSFDIVNGKYVRFDDALAAVPLLGAILDAFSWAEPTGDELIFARMIAQGKTTCKMPSWTYNYRTESKTGFTQAQLNALGKIVATPLGDPPKPSNDWTWLLVGPDQDQSGKDRYIKDLSYQLIPNNPENKMLYGK